MSLWECSLCCRAIGIREMFLQIPFLSLRFYQGKQHVIAHVILILWIFFLSLWVCMRNEIIEILAIKHNNVCNCRCLVSVWKQIDNPLLVWVFIFYFLHHYYLPPVYTLFMTQRNISESTDTVRTRGGNNHGTCESNCFAFWRHLQPFAFGNKYIILWSHEYKRQKVMLFVFWECVCWLRRKSWLIRDPWKWWPVRRQSSSFIQ